MTKLVELNNNQIITTSVNIAENFEREHHNIIKSIEVLKKDQLD